MNRFMIQPSLAEYLAFAKDEGAIPVVGEILADFDTPMSAYWKLAHDEPHSFLLESVTGGEQVARYSVLGVSPRKIVEVQSGSRDDDPMRKVQAEIKQINPAAKHLIPPVVGSAVGVISYDYVRTIERLPDGNPDLLGIPDVCFLITDVSVVFDHAKNRVLIIVLSDGTESGYHSALDQIEQIEDRLRGALPALPSETEQPGAVTANVSREDFENSVRKVKEYIGQGDAFQVVPSLRFETKCGVHPLNLYRSLRSLNPSPYMFLLRMDGWDVIGASPELLVSLEDRTAKVRPIAGTRPRGANDAEDFALGEELLADEKERAEHTMLIDLGRNDIGRISDIGTVNVDAMMVIERYSHVMHIVSNVSGQLREGLDAIDLIRATFPAGTLSGAPKIRAMEIIDEVETSRRGLYGGAVGILGAGGDCELAIAIRSIVLKGGTAYVQAGAGIVFDSDPAKEYDECVNKAKAPLRAIEAAQRGL